LPPALGDFYGEAAPIQKTPPILPERTLAFLRQKERIMGKAKRVAILSPGLNDQSDEPFRPLHGTMFTVKP
jgi:hypothetical protein